jgi:RND family efflux transporter MFP subunit
VGRLKLLAWSLVGMAVMVAAGWWWLVGSVPMVTAVTPVRGTAVEIVYATGAVEPIRWAKVASLIRNRIIEICDCEGKTVAKGDMLGRLDDKDVRAQLHELRAREEFATRELARQTDLIGRGSTTTQAYERASMDLRAIQGLISVQTEKLADYLISAPIDGVVLRRDGEVGEVVEAGQILFRIGVLKPLQIVAEVNEEDIPDWRSGRQNLPHQGRAARRYAAAARHERGGERGHTREGRRAAHSSRCGARNDRLCCRW